MNLAAKLLPQVTSQYLTFTFSHSSTELYTHKKYFMVNTKILELFYLENVALTFQRFSAFFGD